MTRTTENFLCHQYHCCTGFYSNGHASSSPRGLLKDTLLGHRHRVNLLSLFFHLFLFFFRLYYDRIQSLRLFLYLCLFLFLSSCSSPQFLTFILGLNVWSQFFILLLRLRLCLSQWGIGLELAAAHAEAATAHTVAVQPARSLQQHARALSSLK